MTYQYEYCEQQFPYLLFLHVSEPKLGPHRPDVLTPAAIAIGIEAKVIVKIREDFISQQMQKARGKQVLATPNREM